MRKGKKRFSAKIFNDIHVFRIGLDDKIYKDILVDQKREIHV